MTFIFYDDHNVPSVAPPVSVMVPSDSSTLTASHSTHFSQASAPLAASESPRHPHPGALSPPLSPLPVLGAVFSPPPHLHAVPPRAAPSLSLRPPFAPPQVRLPPLSRPGLSALPSFDAQVGMPSFPAKRSGEVPLPPLVATAPASHVFAPQCDSPPFPATRTGAWRDRTRPVGEYV